jgi:NADH:ubiquinone oxidoreductase subunit H
LSLLTALPALAHPFLCCPVAAGRILFHGVHHIALLCESLERSLDFYCGILGLEVGGWVLAGWKAGSRWGWLASVRFRLLSSRCPGILGASAK